MKTFRERRNNQRWKADKNCKSVTRGNHRKKMACLYNANCVCPGSMPSVTKSKEKVKFLRNKFVPFVRYFWKTKFIAEVIEGWLKQSVLPVARPPKLQKSYTILSSELN